MKRILILLSSSLFFLFACGGGGSSNTPNTQSSSSTDTTDTTTTPKTFKDLCASTAVLFCDDFEQGIATDWISDGGDVGIVPGYAKIGEGNNVVELRTYEGISSSKLLYTFANENEVYVRYDVQYASDYDNSGGSHGPALGGSLSPPWGMLGIAGKPPGGDDYFVLNHEPEGIVGSNAEFSFYAYFVNMSGIWGNSFLSSVSPKPLIIPGQWHCVEFGLRLNTAGASNQDGKAFFWVDNVMHGNFDNFQWRIAGDLMINTFMLDSYNHFNSGPRPASSPNRVRYDNIVISTQPVGCL